MSIRSEARLKSFLRNLTVNGLVEGIADPRPGKNAQNIEIAKYEKIEIQKFKKIINP